MINFSERLSTRWTKASLRPLNIFTSASTSSPSMASALFLKNTKYPLSSPGTSINQKSLFWFWEYTPWIVCSLMPLWYLYLVFYQMSLSFCMRVMCFISYSLLLADDLSGCVSWYTRLTGCRILVYFAHFVSPLCSPMRRSKSVVIPV